MTRHVKSDAKVTVRDQHQRVVGTGALGDGTWEAIGAGSTIVNCELPFAFPVSPAKRYLVEVGTRQVAMASQKAPSPEPTGSRSKTRCDAQRID